MVVYNQGNGDCQGRAAVGSGLHRQPAYQTGTVGTIDAVTTGRRDLAFGSLLYTLEGHLIATVLHRSKLQPKDSRLAPPKDSSV